MDIETDFIGTVLRHRYVYALEEGPFRCENGSRYYDAEKHIIQFNRNRVSCGTLLLDVNQKILINGKTNIKN
jgi:hypothetical protein